MDGSKYGRLLELITEREGSLVDADRMAGNK